MLCKTCHNKAVAVTNETHFIKYACGAGHDRIEAYWLPNAGAWLMLKHSRPGARVFGVQAQSGVEIVCSGPEDPDFPFYEG